MYGIIFQKGCGSMGKENTLNIEQNVCTKRIVVDTEAETDDYERKKFFEELNRAIDRSEDDIKNGRVRDVNIFLKEMKEKYGIK